MSQNYENMLAFDPWSVVEEFEQVVASYLGSPYAVSMDTGTIALELALRYYAKMHGPQKVKLPKHTFYSVPQAVLHAGHELEWASYYWVGQYQLHPTTVIDSACRFSENIYEAGTMLMVSFDVRKHLKIGRGGMLLTDDTDAYEWLRKARNNGRASGSPAAMPEFAGWNVKLDPERAMRGLMLMRDMPRRNVDLTLTYPNISEVPLV